MSAIGETLRRERLRRNLDLEKISRELKISLKFLEAIEHEQFGKLPGGVFAKSFVRQYARLLGLDEEELAGEVQRAMDPPQSVPQIAEVARQAAVDIHVPRVEAWQYSGESRFSWSSSLPALAGLVVVMLVCSGLYAWWQRQRSLVSAHQDAPAAVQTAQTAPNPPPAPATEPPPSQAQTAPAEPAAGKPDRAPDPATAAARPAAGQPGLQPSFPPNPNATVHLQVTADETVWMLVRADDKYLFSGTLEPNQTRTVEATDNVLLRLGNAGGVTITLNGKPVGSVGPKGQVRTVQFTSGGFQIVAVPKPSLPLEDNL